MSGSEAAADELWASARQRYEAGAETVSAIARSLSVTAQALTARARREGWALRGAAKPKAKSQSTRVTLARVKALLEQRLADFEAQIAGLSAEASAATTERDIRAMNTLVRTLEKVLELERKERSRRKQQRDTDRRFDDAEREALADKLDGLSREIEQARTAERDAATGDQVGPLPEQ
jgi:TolA-binding protein